MPFPLTLRRLLPPIAATAVASTLLITPPPAQAAPVSPGVPRAQATPATPASSATPASPASPADPAVPAAPTGPGAGTPLAAVIVRSNKIVVAARSQKGKPYRYGAAGPSAFDCSGLSGFAYAKVGLQLPRTASAQYKAARKISKAIARPGDLVFWVSEGHAYHVGVFAGAGRVWHAPKPGDHVRLGTIWSWNQVGFGRIGG